MNATSNDCYYTFVSAGWVNKQLFALKVNISCLKPDFFWTLTKYQGVAQISIFDEQVLKATVQMLNLK